MIIFGKNSDDKGTQFENLSFSLLELLGFTNIVRNDIRGGGAEIDIRAEMKLPSLVDSQSHRVICECKAYGKPANINDWLKFLGKVFSEEKRLQQTVYGYFIALNGVNGNVAGHFDDLQTYVKYVKLVNGENLLELVRKKYSFCDLETVNITLKRFTKRQVQAIEIAYYDHQIFWVITFEKDVYTILQSDSNPVNQEFIDSNKLDEAIKYELSAMSFVDLKREAEAIRRAILLEKYIICQFIISNQNLSLNQIINSNTEYTYDEIIQAINRLEQKLWISKNEIQEYCLLNNKETFYLLLIEVYRFLFQGEFFGGMKDIIKSDYHKLHINQDLIEEIKKIQGDINLTNQNIEEMILLLKFSPSALRWGASHLGTKYKY